jgi:mono/diheme cytochrome c family protein
VRAGIFAALACGVVVMVTGCHRLQPPTPLNQLNAQQTRGHRVYEAHCGQCHYDRQEGPLHGPSLGGVFKKPYLQSGAPANDERVTATVLHGHGLMPAAPTMDPQDLNDLLAYLHTL